MARNFVNMLCLFVAIGWAWSSNFAQEQASIEEDLGIDVPPLINLAPITIGPDLQNRQFDLRQTKGKLVLVNFWATWCLQCLREFPSLQKLQERLSSESFEIVAIAVQDRLKRITKFLEDKAFDFTFVLDLKGEIYKKYGVRVLPTTFLIDKQGRMIARIVGDREWDDPKWEVFFRDRINLK